MNGLLSDGFVLFLFSQSANLGNADGGKQDQIRRKREAEKIDDRAEGEWHDLLNIGVAPREETSREPHNKSLN